MRFVAGQGQYLVGILSSLLTTDLDLLGAGPSGSRLLAAGSWRVRGLAEPVGAVDDRVERPKSEKVRPAAAIP